MNANKLKKTFIFTILCCSVSWGEGPVSTSAPNPSSLPPTTPLGNLSLLAGVGFLNNTGGSGFSYGLSTAWTYDPNFQLGAQFNSLNPSNTIVSGVAYSNTLTNIDGVARWVPSGTADGLKLGVLAGIGILNVSAPGGSSSTNFNYGITASYDYLLTEHWSIGPQMDIIFNTGSNTYTDTNIFFAGRYWF